MCEFGGGGGILLCESPGLRTQHSAVSREMPTALSEMPTALQSGATAGGGGRGGRQGRRVGHMSGTGGRVSVPPAGGLRGHGPAHLPKLTAS